MTLPIGRRYLRRGFVGQPACLGATVALFNLSGSNSPPLAARTAEISSIASANSSSSSGPTGDQTS
jgi:hypothetical protein